MSGAGRHHLDHAATTPVSPAARAAFVEALDLVGNPSSLHASGRAARRRLEEARESVAASLGARPAEVVLTSGGTEADQLAVAGSWRARRGRRPGLAVSSVEHPAVAETAAALVAEGAELVELAVDAAGQVQPCAWQHLDDRTAVASVMWVNNETGAVNDPTVLVEHCRRSGAWSHADAVQAVGVLEVDFAASGLDLMTVSGHKLGAPVGVGALLLRRELTPVALGHGGGQERELVSGTVPVALAAALAAALAEVVDSRQTHRRRCEGLRARLLRGLAGHDLAGWRHHGPDGSPAVVMLGFEGVAADDLLLLLDAAGIDCSTGSACTAGVVGASPVLLATGVDQAGARAALRFSFGATSTEADVDALLTALPGAVATARAVGGSR